MTRNESWFVLLLSVIFFYSVICWSLLNLLGMHVNGLWFIVCRGPEGFYLLGHVLLIVFIPTLILFVDWDTCFYY